MPYMLRTTGLGIMQGMFEDGERALLECNQRNTELVSMAFYLNLLLESIDPNMAVEAASLRDASEG